MPLHALLLGGIGSAITIWSAHFADTLLHRPALGGATLLDARLYAHSLGTAVVLTGITMGQQAVALIGAGIVMAARHTTAPVVGMQFHPESVLTPYGPGILRAVTDDLAAARARTT